MQFVPLFVALVTICLQQGISSESNLISKLGQKSTESYEFVYVQERRLADFLQQSIQQKEAFLSKLQQEAEEEEKNMSGEEEQEKNFEQDEEEEGESESQEEMSQPNMLTKNILQADKITAEEGRLD